MSKKIVLLAICVGCISANAYSAPQHCYSDGEKATLQGIAATKPLIMAGGSMQNVWVLNTTKPICVIERDVQKLVDVSIIQIIGSPPPTEAVIELKGTLSTGNITQSYAVPTAIHVTSGRKISDTNSPFLANAPINCQEVNYDNPNYHANMDKLATLAKLRDGYWSRNHEDVVSDLCKGTPADIKSIIDTGYVSADEVEAIAAVLGKNYKAKPRTAEGKLYENIYNKLLELELCTACASNVAAEYVKTPSGDLTKLVDSAIAGDKNAIEQLKQADFAAGVTAAKAVTPPAPAPAPNNNVSKIIGIIALLALAAWLIYKNAENLFRSRHRITFKRSTKSRLITCKDCEKEYSRDAKRCIHCGARKPPNSGNFILGTIFVLGLVAMCSTGKQGSKSDSPCYSDWKKCSDNADLANNYQKYSDVQYACESAAKDMAKYGKPEFSMISFGSFRSGKDYIETGIVDAYEKDAKFQNGFGAMEHVRVECTYDLNQMKVINIAILPK